MKRLAAFGSWSTGFAVMGAEVAAGRLLAPAFGTSTLVWSVLVGVVLGGLAVGARLGGRWSRRPSALRELFLVLLAAGGLLAILPSIARPLMGATVAHFLRGELGTLALGLGAALALLAVPVVVLGAASPILLHHATSGGHEVGPIAGRLSALGTIGSLFGTFVCGVVLVPLVGTEATFRVCGGVTFVLGAVGLAKARPSEAARLAAAAAAPAALLVAMTTSRSPIHPRALYERETAYNYIRVADEGEKRALFLNEGYATQTVAWRDGRAYLGGVWGYYALAPSFATHAPSRILVLGLGGGASARDYARRYPKAEIVAVELDPGVVDVARRYFDLPSSVDVHVEDARTFVARDTGTYDVVVIDAFQFPYVPFQLTTVEFFRDVRRHLRAGGAVMLNAGRKGAGLDVVHAVASTLEAVFPYVSGANVGGATNTILVATDHALDRAIGTGPFTADEAADLGSLAPVAPWIVPQESRVVLTDDRAPVEWLTHKVVARELARMTRGRS